MAQSDGRSLQQIRLETEQTRTELMQTVEQLRSSVLETSQDVRERMKPATIKREMANYVRSRGEQWLDDLKVAARDNPLQAVAIGSGLAYPLFRLMRTVPLPLLMIGAGFYLAGSRSGKTVTERVSSTVDQLRQAVGQQAEEAGDRMGETKASIGARGAELKESVAQKAGNVADTVKGFAGQAASAGQRYAGAARDATQGAVQSVKETASDLTGRTTRTFTETLEQNPLAIAGVGLLIGGVIAGALPRTDFEDGLLGGTSQSVGRRARSAASRGFDAARDAADQAARSAYHQAEQEGLDPESMRERMRDVGERVQRVAEAAVTTAFEPPEDNDPSNHQGASHHG